MIHSRVKSSLSLKHASKSFGNLDIVEDANAEIDRGDKIALIGANGKGKSTVLRMIAGTENFEGERTWGHNVDESFYAQHQLEALNINNTVLEEMMLCGSGKTELELRTLLGCFLFSGDDVDKRIKVLSGGEKARVALAKVIAGKANFLLLDEPTNHLDMHSIQLLIDALNRYEGTLILVSHDRYFVSKTANKIWEIVDHELKEFKGDYEEYVDWKERMALSKKETAAPKEEKTKKQTVAAPKNDNGFDKELQKLKKQFAQVEQQLEGFKSKLSAIETQLALPENYTDQKKFSVLEKDYKTIQTNIKKANADYEVLFDKILNAEN